MVSYIVKEPDLQNLANLTLSFPRMPQVTGLIV